MARAGDIAISEPSGTPRVPLRLALCAPRGGSGETATISATSSVKGSRGSTLQKRGLFAAASLLRCFADMLTASTARERGSARDPHSGTLPSSSLIRVRGICTVSVASVLVRCRAADHGNSPLWHPCCGRRHPCRGRWRVRLRTRLGFSRRSPYRCSAAGSGSDRADMTARRVMLAIRAAPRPGGGFRHVLCVAIAAAGPVGGGRPGIAPPANVHRRRETTAGQPDALPQGRTRREAGGAPVSASSPSAGASRSRIQRRSCRPYGGPRRSARPLAIPRA